MSTSESYAGVEFKVELEVFQSAAASTASFSSMLFSTLPESANTIDLRPLMSTNSNAGRLKTVVNFTAENNVVEAILDAASRGVSETSLRASSGKFRSRSSSVSAG